MPYEYPEPYPRVLVMIGGRQRLGVLRRRVWDAGTEILSGRWLELPSLT